MTDVPTGVAVLAETRGFIRRLTDDLSGDALRAIPDGWNNNVLWHLGHLVVTQQLLHYGLTGLPLYVEEDLVAR
jgi:hypothetical protein